MDNEKTEKKPGIFGKIGALWKSGTKGKVICIVGVLVILGIIGAFSDDEEGGGGGGDLEYTGAYFDRVFNGVPKDEGVVYRHFPRAYGVFGMVLNDSYLPPIKVMQATKKGNLVTTDDSDRIVWVETKRRYEDDEKLDQGYYIRRGSMEYTTAFGAEKTVARYVEVTDKKMLEKIKEMEAKEKAEEEAREAKEKAEEEARKAKKKAEKKAREAKRKAEEEARKAARESTVKALAVEGTRAGETKVITLPGGVQMEMVWCPAGTFLMGSPAEEHRVTLTRGFWMAKTEVTQKQWKSVMGKNPSNHEGDDLPVEEVSWDDCQTFCQDTGLRLPTEAEWEYACRAGTTGDYGGTGSLDDMGWYDDNSGRETHPVEQKQPNAWGLYDMHGNVEEWCADWHSQYPSGSVTDPKGDSSGWYRVRRGGGWLVDAARCRSADRRSSFPSDANDNLGFRPVSILSE